LPRVIVAYKQEFGDIPSVNVDTFSFVDKALDYLVSRGRRRVAVVLGSQPQSFHAYLAAGIAKRGLESEPYWMQSVSPHMPEAARNCAHLLMHAGQKRRPDGLIVADDNLVEHAVAGLVAAGADVAGAVEVIVHCNFPWPTPSVLPVRRLGYDVRQILSVCIECIDQQRRGELPQSITLLPALFEDEVASQVNSGVAAGV
jgi:DNA-binding LacI/PurR family transcriptional regulator